MNQLTQRRQDNAMTQNMQAYTFEQCISKFTRGMDWDIDLRITYQICPPDRRSGIMEPSPEIVGVESFHGEWMPLSDELFGLLEMDIEEACFEHMAGVEVV